MTEKEGYILYFGEDCVISLAKELLELGCFLNNPFMNRIKQVSIKWVIMIEPNVGYVGKILNQ